MSNTLKFMLERTFQEEVEFHSRVQKKWYKDKIYRGMFEKTLLSEGYTKLEIELAVAEGWMKPEKMFTVQGHRNAFVWLNKEMPQRETLKIFLDKIYRYLTGDFEEYYGR